MAKILVIEDETILREELVEWLLLEGHDALSAQDGIIGIERALEHLPDLIISDIMMPRLDGYGVLAQLQTHPTTVGIPLIFLTAKAAHDDIHKGMTVGADDYITKPFTRLELLQTIQSCLAPKRSATLDAIDMPTN